jgi:hypothetical protein
MNLNLEEIINKFSKLLIEPKFLDEALEGCNDEYIQEYEEEIELWKTYGGN